MLTHRILVCTLTAALTFTVAPLGAATADGGTGDKTRREALVGRVGGAVEALGTLPRLAAKPGPRALQLSAFMAAGKPAVAFTDSQKARAAANALVPATTPVITAPTAGSTATGLLTVTANSTAPTVRFAMQASEASVDAPVVGGTATAQISTYGAHGSQVIEAADCDDLDSCGASATISVTVDNVPPTMTSPVNGSVVGTSFTAAANSSGGNVGFLLNGVLADVATGSPFERILYTDGLSAGQYPVQAVVCNTAGTVCATERPGTAVTVTVKKNLTPSIRSVSPSPFSPGNDGRKDTTSVTYRLETLQTVTWSVRNGNGTRVVGPRYLGAKGAGTHSFTFNGRSNNGNLLGSGRYTLHLDTAHVVTGSTLRGHAQATVLVDRSGPRAANVHPSTGTFHPAKDGYRDSVKLIGRINERLTILGVQITNAAGKSVKKISSPQSGPGLVGVSWNGTDRRGRRVPAGTYQFRFSMQDTAGNRGTSGRSKVTVSDKRLVKKSGSKTVSAIGSSVRKVVGACSDVFSPGARGWKGSIGYYSDYYGCSYYDTDYLASVDHATTVPQAIRYGSMRIDTYGGKSLNAYNDVAAIIYYTADGSLSNVGRVLGSAPQWWKGPSVGPKFITQGGRIKWLAGNTGGNYYDIRSFAIHYTYYVLR